MYNHFNNKPSGSGRLPASVSGFFAIVKADLDSTSFKDNIGLRGRNGMRNEYDLRIDDTRNRYPVIDMEEGKESRENNIADSDAYKAALLDDEGRD